MGYRAAGECAAVSKCRPGPAPLQKSAPSSRSRRSDMLPECLDTYLLINKVAL
jgi:hypothetical protein